VENGNFVTAVLLSSFRRLNYQHSGGYYHHSEMLVVNVASYSEMLVVGIFKKEESFSLASLFKE
jgi:hypothetical protein